jgi:L-ascorbate metabolism protein UlaG (beta-lactamase superfamily)
VAAPQCRITYVGGPTALIEVGGVRLLTDPTFDPAGGRYSMGPGILGPAIRSEKLQPPAVGPDQVGEVDAVLLSHDQHQDNLDHAGRDFLRRARSVITTSSGARRLGEGAVGLAPFESTTLDGDPAIVVTATPARHGPPLSRPVVGDTIGFLLEWEGQANGALWISGDTVRFRGLDEVGRRFRVGTGLLHLGGARFVTSGPIRYTMNASEGARVAQAMGLRTVIPIHYEGWRHLRQGREEAERELSAAGLADRVIWLRPGEPTAIEC